MIWSGAQRPHCIADREQGNRRSHALYSHRVLQLLLYLTTSIFRHHTAWWMALVGVNTFALRLRAHFLIKSKPFMKKDCGFGVAFFTVTAVLIGLFCGTPAVAIIISNGFESWVDSLVIAWVAGITAGAVFSHIQRSPGPDSDRMRFLADTAGWSWTGQRPCICFPS